MHYLGSIATKFVLITQVDNELSFNFHLVLRPVPLSETVMPFLIIILAIAYWYLNK